MAGEFDLLLDRLHDMGCCGCVRCADPRLNVGRCVLGVGRGFVLRLVLADGAQESKGRTLVEATSVMVNLIGAGVPENYDPAEAP